VNPKTAWTLAAALTLTLLPAVLDAQPGRRTFDRHPSPPNGMAEKAAAGEEMEKKKDLPKPEEKIVETRHRATIGGREIAYTATAGTLLLKEEDGTPKASVFFVAYTRDGVEDPRARPVTFTFNGGPGSSSVWLHMGAFGPRRVVLDPEGRMPAPPFRMEDNAESLLDVTDLVFIDPVTTGFSRAVPGEDDKQFHGVREDVESVGELIRLWTGRYDRWASPKFLAGESYGTTRAAGLANHLQDRHGMYFNGILLISSILNFQTARFDVGNDLPYPLFLPTYTATAWYHRQLPADLQGRPLREVLDEAERFALGEYALALLQGNDLAPEAWRATAEQVARFTGLSPEFVERTNLRPQIQQFVKELRRDERITVGRLDSRFEGVDRHAAGEGFEYDPSYAAIQGPYTAVMNDYVRRELGFTSDLAYEILTGRVRPWSYEEFQGRYLNVADDLRQAMVQNPSLRVFVANGYYDLATPYFATEYTFNHLGFDPIYKERVEMGHYESGHMMYIRDVDRRRLKEDLAGFIRSAVGGR
jgi:carboxypeptidase C (cathepsin A)